MLRRTGSLFALLAILVLVLTQVSPALAHHKDGHERGNEANSGFTENDDTNDGGTRNNVADEGDNRHPSGRDRSVEHGGSGYQGNSTSDPDDDGHGPDRSNGGPDKPDGSGGHDLADQDGNNGCGNDDDFEDDNEGWCGKPTETGGQVLGSSDEICVEDAMTGTFCDVTGEGASVVEVDDDVLGREDEATPVGTAGDSVLGTRFDAGAPVGAAPATVGAAEIAAAPAGVLPFTGAALAWFAFAGLGMLGTGAALVRRRR